MDINTAKLVCEIHDKKVRMSDICNLYQGKIIYNDKTTDDN